MDIKIPKRIIKESNENGKSKSKDSKHYQDPGRFLGVTVEVNGIDEKELVAMQKMQRVVKGLALALAHVGRAVQRKFLKQPLGKQVFSL